jgi:glycosyltransferase involved in cell wall biosynthesis
VTSIIHVISGLGTGGAESMLVRLAGGLQKRGFDQHVISVSGRGTNNQKLEALDVPVTALDLKSIPQAPIAAGQVVRLVNTIRPDILQGWMYHGDLFATLAHYLAAGRRSRRLLWNIRASNMDQGGYGGLLRLNAFLSRKADMILANSKAGLEFHIAKGYRPRRSAVIPNGIDLDKFRPDAATRRQVRSELGLPAESLVAIHVARVDPMKDHATFLSAMRMAPDVRGIVVGKDTDKLDIPPNVTSLGIRADVERLYAAADVVVSTSTYGEGFSNALAEGMSTGLIPITTEVGDARTVIGGAGQIIPQRDPHALAQRLSELAGLSAVERHERQNAARRWIENNFALDRVVDRYAALYEELASPRAEGSAPAHG